MKKSILIVDDDPDLLECLRELLESSGYLIDTANDGPEALEKLRTGHYGGMILNIGLPTISGLDVLLPIRQAGSALPVIVLPSYEPGLNLAHSPEYGAQEVMAKPHNRDHLLKAVETYFVSARKPS